MAYNLIDLLHPKPENVFHGKFYHGQLSPENGETVAFTYHYVDVTEKRYQTLLGNIINNDGATATIKTCEDLEFTKDGIFGTMELQDGNTYKILSVVCDHREAPQQSFRMFKSSAFLEYVVRLQQYDNPWKR